MKIFDASFLLIDRDDAVLIPGKVDKRDWQAVKVILDDGLDESDIDGPDVVQLQNDTLGMSLVIRFTKGSPSTWDADYERWEKDGWLPIGFEASRFYPSLEEYEKAEAE